MKRNEVRQHKGIALLFGVGTLGQHYGGRTSVLQSPENDVEDLKVIAKLNGLEAKSFLNSHATRQSFQTSIVKAAKSLGTGDTLLLAFSGFGGTLPNFAGKGPSNFIKTWCMYDGQILLPEIKLALSAFNPDVNILVISETSFREDSGPKLSEQPATAAKSLQKEIADSVYLSFKDFYDAAALAVTSQPPIQANALWLHACQPNQSAHENAFNGWLTSAIKRVWKGGLFTGHFQQFLEEVTFSLPPVQSPSLEVLGGNTTEIPARRPFAI